MNARGGVEGFASAIATTRETGSPRRHEEESASSSGIAACWHVTLFQETRHSELARG